MSGSITDVPGIKVGHYTDPDGVTGCTVVLCESGALAGVDIRGSAPGTRETDLLRPMNLVERVHAVLLSGGSAFGLAAADGVMSYLEERNVGLAVDAGVVPIVPAAILFDLWLGDYKVRPGPREGYQACTASSDSGVEEGSVGAGTGAAVGKALGRQQAVKGGIGSASYTLEGDVIVSALAAVNSWGSVFDPASGELVAGPRSDDGHLLDSVDLLTMGSAKCPSFVQNTTLGVVATNAPMTKEQVNKVAQMAQDGIAMSVRPAHTMLDGDIVFAISTGKNVPSHQVTTIGSVAAMTMSQAIVRGVTLAKGIAGVPSASEAPGQASRRPG